MANPSNDKQCVCADHGDGAQAAFMALRYHFGMLLGVTDFETEQAYHRGKMRLHNQWLHREGVVWGFDVLLPKDDQDNLIGDIRVRSGLALDALGRELHLDADACLNVAAWFTAHANDDDLKTEMSKHNADANTVVFDAHVVIRFKTCLTRQVPALSEPCEQAGTTTAYSRVFETVEILLRPGPAPDAPTPPYHRLRLLFGLDAPRLDDQGAILAGDQAVLDAPKDLTAFRRCAALDEIDLKPPEGGEFPITLAEISGITLVRNGNQPKLSARNVDVTVRPSHVATAAIQELLCGSLRLPGSPFVVANSVKCVAATNKVTFSVTAPLDAATVTSAAFTVTFRTAAGWETAAINAAAFSAATCSVEVGLDPAQPIPAANQVVRFIAKGSGAAPLLGTNSVPFNNGRDFVHMQKWS